MLENSFTGFLLYILDISDAIFRNRLVLILILPFVLGERIKVAWIPQDHHFISTLLHPSLKHFHMAPNHKNKAIELLKKELSKRTPAPVITGTTDVKPTTTSSITLDKTTSIASSGLLGRCFDQSQSIVKPIPLPINELDQYISLDIQITEKDDVLLFWKENAKIFPILSSIVRDLFAIPASNTTVERLFSSSKNTVTDRRTSLAAEKLNKLLFLQKNLFSLSRTNEETVMANQEQSKRRLSISVDEQISNTNINESSMSTKKIKKTKKNDDYYYSSDDIDDIIHNSTDTDEMLFAL
jgi:hypothetical protein